MNSFGIIVDAGTVEFKRVMPGPIERVWAFITERNNLARWLGDGVLGPAGTRYELKIEGPELPHSTGARIVGTVTRYEPPTGITFTWNHLAPGATQPSIAESIVEIDLASQNEKVVFTLRHSRIDRSFTTRLSTGWHAFLDALRNRLEGNPIEFATTVFPQLLPEYERRFSEVGRTN
jgi:uncharacterized protein YndB with AHSA1/START domain